MDDELKEELRLEALDEIRREPMNIWIEDNKVNLETQFLKKVVAPESHPLDDDYPKFFDTFCDEFRLFAEKVYCEEEQ